MRIKSIARSVSAFALLCPSPGGAAPLVLDWADLIPPEQVKLAGTYGLRGVVSHEAGAPLAGDATDSAHRGVPMVRADLNGKEVKIVGYLVPLGLDGMKIKEFLLAPFLGACIHVPPPPSNQLVLTEFKGGVEMSQRLFADPIVVTGRISTVPFQADLGEQGSTMVGYQLEAVDVRFMP